MIAGYKNELACNQNSEWLKKERVENETETKECPLLLKKNLTIINFVHVCKMKYDVDSASQYRLTKEMHWVNDRWDQKEECKVLNMNWCKKEVFWNYQKNWS